MNTLKMWHKAITIIPRLDKEEWDQLDVVSKWLIATRSAVFVMTVISAAIGGAVAFRDGAFQFWPFFLATVGLVFAHATNNLLNDYVDDKKGIDVDNYYRTQYGPQTLAGGYMSKAEFWRYLIFSGAVALLIGLYLLFTTPIGTLYFILLGAFFLLFYTWPLKYIGLGEPTVVWVWGPLMVGGTYYVTTGGMLTWDVIILGLIYALGPTTVLFGKHIDKSPEDKAKGVNTLPVILGEKRARYSTIGIWVGQYLLVLAAVLWNLVTPVMLITLLALPKFFWAAKIFSKPRPTEEPPDLPPNTWPLYLSAHAFIYNRRFGGLFLLGLIIDVIIGRL